jgi:amino acid transporter
VWTISAQRLTYIQRGRPIRASDIDLDTGRKVWETAEKMNKWRAERRVGPWWKRAYRFAFA